MPCPKHGEKPAKQKIIRRELRKTKSKNEFNVFVYSSETLIINLPKTSYTICHLTTGALEEQNFEFRAPLYAIKFMAKMVIDLN